MVWVAPRVVKFRLRGATYPYEAATAFRFLCDTLIFCYPELLAPQDPAHHLHERSRSQDVWFLEGLPGSRHLIRETRRHQRHDLGPVSSLRQAERVARAATQRRKLRFAPDPFLSILLPLWGSTTGLTKKRLRRLAAGAAGQHALDELDLRGDAAQELSPTFGAALHAVDWSEIHRLPHSSSRQRLLFLKIKGLRLTGWDKLHERRGCPHCPTLGSRGGSTYHIVWECPSAQRLWTILRTWWSVLALWPSHDSATTQDFFAAIFSLRLPRTPPTVWDLTSLSQCPPTSADTPDGPYPALQVVWQQLVLETLVVIVAWRSARTDATRAWTPTQAILFHMGSCQRVLSTLAHRYSVTTSTPSSYARLILELRELWASLPSPRPFLPPMPEPAAATHNLFFDGGSRGNPGPGGSGACVVCVDGHTCLASIVWSASMSHAHRATTNNQAEYLGLLTGLRAARRSLDEA